MSKIYLQGKTDTKSSFTAGGNKYIDLDLGFDEDNYNRKLNVRFNTMPSAGGVLTLWVAGNKVCEIQNNKLSCELKKFERDI